MEILLLLINIGLVFLLIKGLRNSEKTGDPAEMGLFSYSETKVSPRSKGK